MCMHSNYIYILNELSHNEDPIRWDALVIKLRKSLNYFLLADSSSGLDSGLTPSSSLYIMNKNIFFEIIIEQTYSDAVGNRTSSWTL